LPRLISPNPELAVLSGAVVGFSLGLIGGEGTILTAPLMR
jgi:uncharacterized membrane protein YfcA